MLNTRETSEERDFSPQAVKHILSQTHTQVQVSISSLELIEKYMKEGKPLTICKIKEREEEEDEESWLLTLPKPIVTLVLALFIYLSREQ